MWFRYQPFCVSVFEQNRNSCFGRILLHRMHKLKNIDFTHSYYFQVLTVAIWHLGILCAKVFMHFFILVVLLNNLYFEFSFQTLFKEARLDSKHWIKWAIVYVIQLSHWRHVDKADKNRKKFRILFTEQHWIALLFLVIYFFVRNPLHNGWKGKQWTLI